MVIYMSIHENIWQEACQRIKNSGLIMDVQYTTWIQPVEKAEFGTEFMFLWAPNSIAKSSIEDRYAEIINSHCEQCEFFIKILSDYNGFKTTKKTSEKLNDFIELKWKDYVSEFNVGDIDEEIQEAITKIIIHNIIKRRFTIDRIKKEVNLC